MISSGTALTDSVLKSVIASLCHVWYPAFDLLSSVTININSAHVDILA